MVALGEAIYLLQLIALQSGRIAPYWIAGLLVGSFVSVYLSSGISKAVARLNGSGFVLPKSALAALLGAASPLCMYGTIPLLASLGRSGARHYLLGAFMVGSILINPNLFIFSFALGAPLALLRLGACLTAGTLAGVALALAFKDGPFFDFTGFEPAVGASNPRTVVAPGTQLVTARVGTRLRDYLASLKRGALRTAPYFLAGLVLTALFERFFPRAWAERLFLGNRGLGVLVAASVGVPVYVCGGGTIPLLKAWLDMGMSAGSALAFMISGPATKLTNLGAVKIILGTRNFILYLAFCVAFAIVAGLATDAARGLFG